MIADEEDLPFDHSTEHQIAIEEAAIHAAAAAAAAVATASAKHPSVHSDAHSLSSDELMEKASSSPSSVKKRKLADSTAQDAAGGHDADAKKLDHDDDVTVALL